MKRIMISAVVAAAVLSGCATAADWPQYRGPASNAVSAEKIVNKAWGQKPPKMLWKTAMTDNGFAGPAVAGGKVFIIDHKGTQDVVRAIDANTGKDIWQYAYDDGKGDNYGFSRATPTVDTGKVYIQGRMGVLTCLNAATGKLVWTRDLKTDFGGKRPTWNYSMSPVVDGNKLIVCPGGNNASVAALDKTTGKTIWQGGGSDVPGYATPVIATINGKKQYVVFTGVSIMGVDAAQGTQLWSVPWKTAYDVNAANPIVVGNNVFITSGYDHGCGLVAVAPSGASLKWEKKDLACKVSCPLMLGNVVYGVSESGELLAMNPLTGSVSWKKGGFEFGGLLAADGTLIVMDGRAGDVVMVKADPASYQELGRFKPLGDQSWTAPILSDGKLIVRNKSALAAFSLK